MLNPFGDQNVPGSYSGLYQRMLNRLRDKNIEEQITGLILQSYETALNAENVVLSRPERKRLLAQLSKQVLEDVSKRLTGEDA